MPELTSETRTAHLGVVNVALNFASRTRQTRECAIGEQNGVPGVFPALVLQSRLRVAAAVLDVTIAIAVPVCVDPGERSPGFYLQLPYQCTVARPALHLIVQDLARLLIAEVVDSCPLELRQGLEGRFGERGGEGECLVAHSHAVPAEEGHEPG